ncbi:MAG: type II toxin-antitoxin system RelE/ParE family toxin [Xanthomonadaceae bacterium]|nr:type II toxin-antitoxin system RelE/ParE family toxin [Xanthomonadaceae bacterium]
MSYQVRFTFEASDDLERLFSFLVEKDVDAARRAIEAIRKGVELLRTFPFSCRKVDDSSPLYREILISFGSSGYVALYEIEQEYVSILAVRHQSETDYY